MHRRGYLHLLLRLQHALIPSMTAGMSMAGSRHTAALGHPYDRVCSSTEDTITDTIPAQTLISASSLRGAACVTTWKHHLRKPSSCLSLQAYLGEAVDVQLHEGTHVTGNAPNSEDSINDTIPAQTLIPAASFHLLCGVQHVSRLRSIVTGCPHPLCHCRPI